MKIHTYILISALMNKYFTILDILEIVELNLSSISIDN